MSQTPPPDRPSRTETLVEAPTRLAPPASLAGLPGYRIEKLLGQGGMGEVYLAHNEMMDRPEVLKAVQVELLTKSGALERFKLEIRNAARLQHPNIVTAYTYLHAGDSLVLVMEYVPGQDLAAVVKTSGALPVANAAHYIRQAALGLQHAFEKGMVHRDIKPHNLMLHRDGSKHTVKILDFGLAKVTSEKPVDGGLTRDGQMLGTPDYVAPEQTRDAARADIRSDIYSLGCTLHYLLVGKPPFSGNSLFEILEAHNFKPAPRLDQLRPEVPAALADVVAKMMAKDPAHRYQTPAQVAVTLQPFTRPATKVLMSKPVGLPPVATPAAPAEAGSTAPALSGKTPAPVPGKPVPAATPVPPPVPKAGNSDWYFEDSGSRGPKPAPRPPAPRRKSRLPILLGLLFVFILSGGGIGGLYLAGAFSKSSPSSTSVVMTGNGTIPIEPDPKSEPPEVTPTPPKTAFPKGKTKGKGKGFDPIPVVPPKAEPPKVEPPKVEVGPKPVEKKPVVEPPPVPAKIPEPTLTWAELFNGRDTLGWETGELNGGTWKAVGNELVGTGTDRVTRPAILLTRGAYRNFVLKFESFANDDVERRLLLRAHATGDRLRGYALLLSGTRSAGGALAVYDNDPARCVPVWQRPTADVRPAKGTWNAWEITCVGSRVHVRLNGREVADWELGTDPHSSGGLGFAAAGPAGLGLRKIQVADLPPKLADACKLAGIAERGSETGSTTTPMPFGDAFWKKWQIFGSTDWDLTPDGRMTLSGAGGLVTRADAPDLTLSLAVNADTECWASVKLAGSGAAYAGPGVRLLATGPKVTAGQGALVTTAKPEGTDREYKPGDVFRVEVEVQTRLEFPNGTNGEAERIPRLVGTVLSSSQARQETCKVRLDNRTPGKVGLILKKGTVTIHSIDKP